MTKNVAVLGLMALATAHAASLPPSSKETRYQALPDPSSDITEVEEPPYHTDIYISDDIIPDVVRSKRQFGGFGFGGSGAQAAANSFGGGYGAGGYPGVFGGPLFGSPVGYPSASGYGPYGGLSAGISGASSQSSSNAFGAAGGFWG